MTATVADSSHGIFSRLYNGETAFDFVGHRRRWFALSGTIILVGLLALGIKGLNFGIDFKGGTSWELPAKGVTVSEARSAVDRPSANAKPRTSPMVRNHSSPAAMIDTRSAVQIVRQARLKLRSTLDRTLLPPRTSSLRRSKYTM